MCFKILNLLSRALWCVFLLYAFIVGILGASVLADYAVRYMMKKGYFAVSDDKLFYIVHLIGLIIGSPLVLLIAFKINPFKQKPGCPTQKSI